MKRPAIITIMGHVDHGKTSLLDVIRYTDITLSEYGNITQNIGAYYVKLSENNFVTILDTPGHKAFGGIRIRGIIPTDIIIMIIAANEGIKSQTIEIFKLIKKVNKPFMIIINKIDKNNVCTNLIKNILMRLNIFHLNICFKYFMIKISIKFKIGLTYLKQIILNEIEKLDLITNLNTNTRGIILEYTFDNIRKILATLIVKKGVLKNGNIIVIANNFFKIRNIINDKGFIINLATPSMPVCVSGLDSIPKIGESFFVVKNEKLAKKAVKMYNKKMDKKPVIVEKSFIPFSKILEQKIIIIKKIIIKTNTFGCLEAITNIIKTMHNKQEVKIIFASIGNVSKSDINLANVTKSVIVCFNVKINIDATKLLNNLNIKIKCYSIIYHFINDIQSIFNYYPEKKIDVIGYGRVKKIFLFNNINIAGCLITKGYIHYKSRVKLIREGKIIYWGKILKLKRFKRDIKEVKQGYECGLLLNNFNNININDKLKIYNF